jgi:DNA-binding MarR family transcriptional regulator
METERRLDPPASLGRALNVTTGAINRLAQALLAGHGLQLAQWVVLSALWRRDGLSTGELARYTGNNLPATSRIVDRMVEKGLVRRRTDRRDRRTVRVHLTDAGRAHARLSDFHEQMNAVLMGGLDEGERTALLAMLARVEANARAALGPAARASADG